MKLSEWKEGVMPAALMEKGFDMTEILLTESNCSTVKPV